MSESLPNVVIIGAMKCGTTSLHQYLEKHPQVFMSEKKELNFFIDMGWELGLDWYKAQFVAGGGVAIRGESSPSYSKAHRHPKVVDRMRAIVPDAKLIYLVRDPIKRIESHYYEAVEGGYEPRGDLGSFLFDDEEQHYLLTSSYYYQIEKFLPHFRADQILVVAAEDLASNRLRVLNTIFRFLGIEEMKDNAVFDFRANRQSDKRKKSLIGRFIYSPRIQNIRNLLPRNLKDGLKQSTLVKQLTHQEVQRITLSPQLIDRLKEHLQIDVDQLRQFTGQSFSGWQL